MITAAFYLPPLLALVGLSFLIALGILVTRFADLLQSRKPVAYYEDFDGIGCAPHGDASDQATGQSLRISGALLCRCVDSHWHRSARRLGSKAVLDVCGPSVGPRFEPPSGQSPLAEDTCVCCKQSSPSVDLAPDVVPCAGNKVMTFSVGESVCGGRGNLSHTAPAFLARRCPGPDRRPATETVPRTPTVELGRPPQLTSRPPAQGPSLVDRTEISSPRCSADPYVQRGEVPGVGLERRMNQIQPSSPISADRPTEITSPTRAAIQTATGPGSLSCRLSTTRTAYLVSAPRPAAARSAEESRPPSFRRSAWTWSLTM